MDSNNQYLFNCSSQHLRSMPQNLPKYTNLINVSNNDITHITNINPSFINTTLDLSFNQIEFISKEVWEFLLENIQSLNLQVNNVTNIPQTVTSSKISNMWLSGNPFECNCDMMWMTDWLINATNVIDKDKVVCGPGKWRGMYFYSDILSTFLCNI